MNLAKLSFFKTTVTYSIAYICLLFLSAVVDCIKIYLSKTYKRKFYKLVSADVKIIDSTDTLKNQFILHKNVQ